MSSARHGLTLQMELYDITQQVYLMEINSRYWLLLFVPKFVRVRNGMFQENLTNTGGTATRERRQVF